MVINYDPSLLLGSCVEAASCGVIYFPLHSVKFPTKVSDYNWTLF